MMKNENIDQELDGEAEKEEEQVDVQLDEKTGCFGGCCRGRCCFLFVRWPWVATAAVVLLITGLVMWASTTSPALGKTKDAFKEVGGNIGDVVSVANGFIAIMTALCAIMIAVVTFISVSRFELDVRDRKLDPRRFRYLATHCVGILTLILLSIIFIAAVLLVGFTTVWLALAFVTMEGTEVTGNAIFNEATTPDIKNVCPEKCFDASSLPFLDSDECICGDELKALHDLASDAYDLLILSTVGIYLLIFGTALAMMATSSNCMHLRWRAHMLGISESTADMPSRDRDDETVAEPATDSEVNEV